MDEEKLERAKHVYETMCAALDAQNWRYERDDENLKIDSKAQGDDLPMDLTIRVDAGRQMVLLLSHLPFVVPEEKRMEVAIAVTHVNYKIVDGSFDLNILDGHMFFRMTTSFIDSEIGHELFLYLVGCSLGTIDEYNDKFLMISKGLLKIENFISD